MSSSSTLSTIGTVFTHLGAFLLGLGAGILGLEYYSKHASQPTDNNNQEVHTRWIQTQKGIMTLTLDQIPNATDHQGIYHYVQTDQASHLHLYPAYLPRTEQPMPALSVTEPIQETQVTPAQHAQAVPKDQHVVRELEENDEKLNKLAQGRLQDLTEQSDDTDRSEQENMKPRAEWVKSLGANFPRDQNYNNTIVLLAKMKAGDPVQYESAFYS
jgi:hypothetical protein